MKKLAVYLCIAMLALSFAACGGSSAESTAASAPAASEAASEAAQSTSAGAESTEADAPAEGAIATVADLEGKTIGVQEGTTGDIYSEDIPDARVERFNKGADAVMALRQNKVDAVVIDDQPAAVYVEQNDDIMILDEPFVVEDYAICVSKDKPELTEAMNAAIAELKEDGTLQAILDYYIGGVEGAEPYNSPEDADHSKGTLVMGTNAAFPPYEFWEDNAVRGVDADFARAICDKMGYALEIEDMDFSAVIPAVQSGKADFGAAGMTVTEDRLKNIDFTDSYCTGTQVIIVNK